MPEPVDPQQRFMTPRERLADDVGLQLLKTADDYAPGDLIVGKLHALCDAVMTEILPVLEQVEAERDALKAVRCPSCDHFAYHHDEGCWYAVASGTEGRDLVCPCAVSRAALDTPTAQQIREIDHG